MLELSQQQLAELIGVTFQQAHKYERGINRVTSGRLYEIAQALDVDIATSLRERAGTKRPGPTQHQRLLLEFVRYFVAIPNRRHQEEIVSLARVPAAPDAGPLAVRDSRRRRTPASPF